MSYSLNVMSLQLAINLQDVLVIHFFVQSQLFWVFVCWLIFSEFGGPGMMFTMLVGVGLVNSAHVCSALMTISS